MKRLMALMLALLMLSSCSAPSPAIDTLAQNRNFGTFRACAPSAAEAERAYALVCDALACYPDGFAAQWGQVQILLVGDLTGEGRFDHGRFAGFTQQTESGWLMVLDAGRCDIGTVHHEIAHILDGILTEAGVLTEEGWMAFCPGAFSYGDDNWQDYPDFFADAYAMENLKEDRARTFEEAMLCGAGVYESRPALWLKLSCICDAIRVHFDTGGWPEKTAWEQALERN